MDNAAKQKLLERMRNKQKELTKGRDTTKWEVPKVGPKDEPIEFRIFILPPINEGDDCVGGKSDVSYDMWYVPHGGHFVDRKFFECPRVHAVRSDCPMCQTGFDLMKETNDKEVRRVIAKEWLSRQNFAVNIYFADHKSNPENLRGKVMWWSLPDAIYKKCLAVMDRSDAGDDTDDPQAFGLFFDPDNAFAIKIVVKHKGDYNNYEDSQFVAQSRPIADTPDKIAKILAARHQLTKKFAPLDVGKLSELVAKKTGSDLSGESSDNGSTASVAESVATEVAVETKPTAVAKPVAVATTTAKTVTATAKPAAKPAPVADTSEEDNELNDLLKSLNQD